MLISEAVVQRAMHARCLARARMWRPSRPSPQWSPGPAWALPPKSTRRPCSTDVRRPVGQVTQGALSALARPRHRVPLPRPGVAVARGAGSSQRGGGARGRRVARPCMCAGPRAHARGRPRDERRRGNLGWRRAEDPGPADVPKNTADMARRADEVDAGAHAGRWRSLVVRSCRVMKMEISRVQLSLLDLRVRRLVCQAIKWAGADHRTGRYPASQAEKRIAARRPAAKLSGVADWRAPGHFGSCGCPVFLAVRPPRRVPIVEVVVLARPHSSGE